MRKRLTLLLALCLTLPALAQVNIALVSRDDSNAKHAIAVIELALDKAGLDYQLDISSGTLTAARQIQDALDGTIDIMWAATTKQTEQQLIPIRVPLYKGLLGYRVFIIHKDNRHLFADITDYSQLKSLVFGQGRGWPDTDIMRHNGLTVETGTYEGLFLMADGQRFDAFPRGIHEPWSEVASRSELELAIDDNLMFVYRMPFYLFVSPRRPELAEALNTGLTIALEDGSFDTLIMNDPTVQTVMARGNIAKRRAFALENPNLPAATPVDNPTLWFDPAELAASAAADKTEQPEQDLLTQSQDDSATDNHEPQPSDAP
ncbi:diguanylate cyclase [uncultured Gilvimarinus sp.]|uniref:diguanylate cyclase n=1 Tax=uncultured Gilvimarinus sp. TaxID=1689143 RepID=UPI0030D92042